MNNALKIALGLGAAAAAAALAVSVSKKAQKRSDYDYDDQWSPDEEDFLNKCDSCDSWNGDECSCDDNCGDCDKCADRCEYIDEDEPADMKTSVNQILDRVMSGIVIAAHKVSEVSSNLADDDAHQPHVSIASRTTPISIDAGFFDYYK